MTVQENKIKIFTMIVALVFSYQSHFFILDAHEGAKALQHMGPTGIWGYIASKRSFNIKMVEKGSPADGKLMPGDQVVGAGRMPFLKRVRFELAAAIAQARTVENKGKLVLMVRRKVGGKRMQRITLQLGVVGENTFNKTAPYNCPKVDALITEAAEHRDSRSRREETTHPRLIPDARSTQLSPREASCCAGGPRVACAC